MKRRLIAGAAVGAMALSGGLVAAPASAAYYTGPCGYNYYNIFDFDMAATIGTPSDGCGMKEAKIRYYIPNGGYYTTPAVSKSGSAYVYFYTYPLVGSHHRWTGISTQWTYIVAS